MKLFKTTIAVSAALLLTACGKPDGFDNNYPDEQVSVSVAPTFYLKNNNDSFTKIEKRAPQIDYVQSSVFAETLLTRDITAQDQNGNVVKISVDAEINPVQPKRYFVNYLATDENGLTSTITRDVVVIPDVEPPLAVNEKGEVVEGDVLPELTLTEGQPLPELKTKDNGHDKVKVSIKSGEVGTAIGSYDIVYEIEDFFGNKKEVKRVVSVVKAPDTTPPTIVIHGPSSWEYKRKFAINRNFDTFNAHAEDNEDANPVLTIENPEITGPGVYYSIYTATDKSGNKTVKKFKHIYTTNSDVVAPVGYLKVQQRYEDRELFPNIPFFQKISETEIEILKGAHPTFIAAFFDPDTDPYKNESPGSHMYVNFPDVNSIPSVIEGIRDRKIPGVSEAGTKTGVNLYIDEKFSNDDVQQIGAHIIKYYIQDESGNRTLKEITINTVDKIVDKVAPRISVYPDDEGLFTKIDKKDETNWQALVNSEDEGFYKSAYDEFDNERKVLKVIGAYDINKVGKYVVNYSAVDKAGNIANKEITYNVVKKLIDNIAPSIGFTIKVDGKENRYDSRDQFEHVPVKLEIGSSFELGYIGAYDNIDKDLTDKINLVNTVNTSIPGTYEFTATVSDEAGHITTVSIPVIISPDTTPPKIVLFSNSSVERVLLYDKNGPIQYKPAYMATDNSGKDPKVEIVWDKPLTQFGDYTITINATDDAGNQAHEVVSAKFFGAADRTPPTLTANINTQDLAVRDDFIRYVGKDHFEIIKGGSYVLEAHAYDSTRFERRELKLKDEDGANSFKEQYNPRFIRIFDTIDTNSLGSQELEMGVRGDNNLQVYKTIKVDVVEKLQKQVFKYELSLHPETWEESDLFKVSDWNYKLKLGIALNKPYVREENYNTVKSVKISGALDINKLGTYTREYSIEAEDGSITKKIETIEVVKEIFDTTKPEIKIEAYLNGGKFGIPKTGDINISLYAGQDFKFRVRGYDSQDSSVTSHYDGRTDTFMNFWEKDGEYNTAVPGEYKVIYSLEDHSGNKTKRLATITVRPRPFHLTFDSPSANPCVAGTYNAQYNTSYEPFKATLVGDGEYTGLAANFSVAPVLIHINRGRGMSVAENNPITQADKKWELENPIRQDGREWYFEDYKATAGLVTLYQTNRFAVDNSEGRRNVLIKKIEDIAINDISTFDTHCIADFSYLFHTGGKYYYLSNQQNYDIRNFNQDLSGWDVSFGRKFNSMFRSMSGRKVRYDYDLSGWKAPHLVNKSDMFDDGPSEYIWPEVRRPKL